MGKVGKILSKEEAAIAESNGIPLQTAYKRLQRGWEVERAITTPPKAAPGQKLNREMGEFTTNEPKGKQRSIRLPAEWDEKADQAIAESGLTQSEWIGMAVVEYLKKQQKRGRKSNAL